LSVVSGAASVTKSGVPGAYGLALPDLNGLADQLAETHPAWPEWQILFVQGEPDRPEEISEEGAWLRLAGGGGVLLDRTSRRSTYIQPALPSRDHVLHPMLGCTGAVAAWWDGRPCLHAAAVAMGGSAWAIVADRGGGKTTTAAAAIWLGASLVCDDVLVVAEGAACAGPGCLDLRAPSADVLNGGVHIQVPGDRERVRVAMKPEVPTTPLAGVVQLAWGSSISIERVSPSRRLPILLQSQTVHLPPRDASALLDLAALPMWRFTRPRGIEHLDREVSRLLDTIGAGAAST
jgi:hypothetical protein